LFSSLIDCFRVAGETPPIQPAGRQRYNTGSVFVVVAVVVAIAIVVAISIVIAVMVTAAAIVAVMIVVAALAVGAELATGADIAVAGEDAVLVSVARPQSGQLKLVMRAAAWVIGFAPAFVAARAAILHAVRALVVCGPLQGSRRAVVVDDRRSLGDVDGTLVALVHAMLREGGDSEREERERYKIFGVFHAADLPSW
jgi:hypothetical protein